MRPGTVLATLVRDGIPGVFRLGLLIVSFLFIATPHPTLADSHMARAEVIFGQTVFTVDIAESPAQQAKGLGGREHLGPNDGMLFLYTDKGRHSFWMKGMVIPIDMIWLDNQRVVHIEHRVQPPNPGTPLARLPTYSPAADANIVLEVASGRAQALGLKVGSTVRFRFNVR